MFDKLVWPADPDDWSGNLLFRKVLHYGAAEAVVKDMVLHGADHLASSRKELYRRGIEGFDPPGIDHCRRNALFFQAEAASSASSTIVPSAMMATREPCRRTSALPISRMHGCFLGSAPVPTPRG